MWRKLAFVGTMCLALASTGCPTPVTGLDLSVRGVLNLVISRIASSSIVSARATVWDNGSFLSLITLDSDQFFTVDGSRLNGVPFLNGVYLTQVGVVNPPGTYTVAFNNKGTVMNMAVSLPDDFTATNPPDGSNVSKSGFTVSWSPSGAANTRVDIEIEGLGPDGSDSDTDPDQVSKLLTNLPDTGSANVGTADLSGFNTGAIKLTIRRFREFNQTIGLAEGTVRTEVVREIALNLQ